MEPTLCKRDIHGSQQVHFPCAKRICRCALNAEAVGNEVGVGAAGLKEWDSVDKRGGICRCDDQDNRG